MIRQNEIEEIIRLINDGFDLELISFELDIPMEQIQKYKEQLQLRKSIKEYIKSGKAQIAIGQLKSFIANTDDNIIERMLLLNLQAYIDKTDVNEEDLKKIEEEGKSIGLSKSINEILYELKIQIPRRKTSNIRKKEKQAKNTKRYSKELSKKNIQEIEEKQNANYENVITKYKKEIETNSKNILNKKNALAFAYFKAGKIQDAREELLSLIEQYNSYTAYRQLIHLEKCEGNLEDAKLWAYDCLDKFPDSIHMREQLISIAREENDNQEIINQIKEIISIDPNNKKSKEMLKSKEYEEER